MELYWPSFDYFFQEGTTYFREGMMMIGDEQDYFFVRLEKWNLCDFLKGDVLKGKDHLKVVIICDAVMLPVAHFFIKKCPHVVCAFGSETPLQDVMLSLALVYLDVKSTLLARTPTPVLSAREFYLFKHLFLGCCVKDLARVTGLHPKTIYKTRGDIAKKFGHKKLESILCC